MNRLIILGAIALGFMGCQSGAPKPKNPSKGCKKTQRFTCDPRLPRRNNS